ncbi:DUF305 domain-containing protein [Kineococcus terrestris]|uniref:DUF305 domain-containing protein n=1 Tax=Kineococcus terrestris TaxID=2044856 RepID=UPI0034DAC1C0
MNARTVLVAVVGLLTALLAGVLLGRALPTAPGGQSVDVGFAHDMSTHHQQAVGMALDAVQRAPSAEVRQLAVDIASTQTNQVGRMQQLLLVWDQPLTSGAPVMAWMAGTDTHARHLEQLEEGRTMPGMATAAELAQLGELEGAEYEVRFLQLVLRHHRGGLEMAQVGAERATTEQVRRLAGAIATSQAGESQLLERYLAERGAQPLPDPVADPAVGAAG